MRYKASIVRSYYLSQGLPEPVFEYRIVPDRKYAWDICFPDQNIWIEVQGGIWRGGGHSTGTGLTRDYEKHNLATLHGWAGLYVTPKDVCMLDTVNMIKRLMIKNKFLRLFPSYEELVMPSCLSNIPKQDVSFKEEKATHEEK
jgi:hypothetical protein